MTRVIGRLAGAPVLVLAAALVGPWGSPAGAQVGPAGAVRVTVARANVRSAPSLSGEVLTQVMRDTVLPVQAVEGDWFQVRVSMGGIRFEAYISRTVCERLDTSEAALEPEGAEGATAGPPEARHGMTVSYLQVAGGSLGMPPALAMPMPIEGRERSLPRLVASLPASDAPPARLEDSDEVMWTWVIGAGAAAPVLNDRQPRFIVSFAAVPGIDPDDLTASILRLTPAPDGRRVAFAVAGRAGQAGARDEGWDLVDEMSADVIPAILVPLEPGTLNVQPREELPPGEYAVVVRPADDGELPGAVVLSERGVGALYATAWMFRVAPAARPQTSIRPARR